MRLQRFVPLALLGSAALASMACAPLPGEDDEDRAAVWQPLAHPGPWVIPENTLAIGDTQYIEYTGAGPWIGESGCAPGLTPGAAIVREYLYAHFPQTYHIGGFACRPINGDSTTMSVHGTGRALDVMIPLDDGEADNDLGDPVGNFLIENAEAIGIQYIIWDLWKWNGSRDPGDKDGAYGGAHPHHDHLHIELSVEASEHTEMWFGDVTPPAIEGCEAIPPEGIIIDETSPCFRAFGSASFWRQEQDVGYDGSLIWTNAFESDAPSNWARWNLIFEQAGRYEVEIFLDPAFAVADAVRYEMVTGEDWLEMFVNQSEASGWYSLGQFDFSAGGDQSLDVFDDQPEAVPDDQHVAIDAIRLTGDGSPPPDDPGNPLSPNQPPGDPSDPTLGGIPGGDGCGCRMARSSEEPLGWVAVGAWLFGWLGFARRRRRW